MELALQLEAATGSARCGAGGEELVVQPLYTIADTEMTAVINLGGGDDTLQYAHNALTDVMAALPGCMSVNTNLHETDIQDFEHLSILLQQPSVQQISGAFAELSCLMSRLEGPRVAELSAMKVPVQALGLSAGPVLKRKRSARYALAIGIIRFFQENEIPGFTFRMNSNMAWYVLQCRFADPPMWQHTIEDDYDAIPTNAIEDQEELAVLLSRLSRLRSRLEQEEEEPPPAEEVPSPPAYPQNFGKVPSPPAYPPNFGKGGKDGKVPSPPAYPPNFGKSGKDGKDPSPPAYPPNFGKGGKDGKDPSSKGGKGTKSVRRATGKTLAKDDRVWRNNEEQFLSWKASLCRRDAFKALDNEDDSEELADLVEEQFFPKDHHKGTRSSSRRGPYTRDTSTAPSRGMGDTEELVDHHKSKADMGKGTQSSSRRGPYTHDSEELVAHHKSCPCRHCKADTGKGTQSSSRRGPYTRDTVPETRPWR